MVKSPLGRVRDKTRRKFRRSLLRKTDVRTTHRRLRFEPLEARRVLASISGQVFHDLNGNGTIGIGEPGLENWQLYIDANDNGRFDTGEPTALSDAGGNYVFEELAPGLHKVGQINQSGWTQTFPGGNGRQTVSITEANPAVNIVFGNKRDPTAFTAGNILAVRSSFLDDDLLIEYTRSGHIVQAFVVPGTEDFSRILAKDLDLDDRGRVQIFTKDEEPLATPEEALLTTYDPATATFSNRSVDGWDVTSSTVYAESIATFANFIYVNDQLENGTTSGVIRFDTTDLSFQQFQSGFGEPDQLTIGLDGLLYTMRVTLSTTTVSVYQPDTMTFVRSFAVADRLRRMAVDEQGQVFATSDTGLKHFDANGALVKSTIEVGGQDIEIGSDGTILLTNALKVEMIDRDFTSASISRFNLPGNVSINLAGFATFVEPPVNAGVTNPGGGMTGVFTNGNILVSNSPFSGGVPKLYEYTPFGQLVQEFDIPVLDGAARDLAVDHNGNVQIYNGTFDPSLSTFDSEVAIFSHTKFDGWSTVNNRTFGGVAAFDNFVFATDAETGDDSSQQRGIVRYNVDTGQFQRFHANLGETIDINVGLNGLLYTLGGADSPIGRTVREFNPSTMQLLRTITLPASHRAIAVDTNGDIFAVHPTVTRYSASGNVLEVHDPGGVRGLADIDIDDDGRLLIASQNGDIVLSDRKFTAFFSFPTRVSNGHNFAAFVSGTRGLPKAEWDAFTVTEDTSGNLIDVLANDVGSFLTVTGVGVPDQGGTVVMIGGSQLSYTPVGDFVGVEKFTYTIEDGAGNSDTGLVTIHVEGAAVYSVVDESYVVDEDDFLEVFAGTGLLANDGALDVFPVLTPGNILITDASPVPGQPNLLQEYTRNGVLVRSIEIPDFTGGSREIRDLVVDINGNVQIYNGTFTPRLTTYDPVTDSQTHTVFANWNSANNVTFGGAAAWKNFVYFTDQAITGETSSQLGIVRFNVQTLQGERFPDQRLVGQTLVDVDFIDVAVGLDGFLYALGPGGSPSGTYVRVYNPDSMTFVREITLPRENRAITVTGNGDIYGINHNDPNIYHYDRNGTLLRTFNTTTAPGGLPAGTAQFSDIDIANNGFDLLLANRDFILDGDVVLTNTAFNRVTHFVAPNRRSSMKFAAWVQSPVEAVTGPLRIASYDQPIHGMVDVDPDGAFTYTPDPDFSGTDTFRYIVRDADGHQAEGTATITVLPVNDPPELTPANPTFEIDEDSTFNAPLAALVNGGSGTTTVTDVDENASIGGVAVIGSSGPGSWQYSLNGTIYVNVGVVSEQSALLLPRHADLRFVPGGAGGGDASITYRAWDRTSGTSGAKTSTTFEMCEDMSMIGMEGLCADLSLPLTIVFDAFSEASDTFTLMLGDVNDAPILVPSGPLMGTTDEETPIEVVVGDFVIGVTDPDTGAGVEGIALTGSSGRSTWEYSLDGVDFIALPALSDGAALLLDPDDVLRYTPDLKNGERPTVTYRAWDRTDQAATGTLVDVTDNGGTTAYSDDVDTASLIVNDLNDAPVLVPAFANIGITDAATTFTISLSAFVTGISDVDTNDPVGGIAVTGLAGQGTWSYSLNGVDFTAFGTVSPASALLLEPDDQVRYVPNGTTAETATLSFHAWDASNGAAGESLAVTPGGGETPFSIASDTSTLTIIEVNDPPVILAPSGPANYVENDPPTVIDPAITITDVDSPNFAGGSFIVSILGTKTTADQLQILPTGGISTSGQNVFFNNGSIDLLIGSTLGGIAGSDLVVNLTTINATPTAVQALARAIGYSNTSDNPQGNQRVVRFTVTDGDGGNSSAMATQTVQLTPVNDIPIVMNDSYEMFAGTTLNVSPSLGVLLNDFDLENDPLTVQLISSVSGGTLSLNSNGSFIYTPRVNFFGTDAFSYRASDGLAESTVAVAEIHVRLPHRNPAHAADINGDGFLSAIDPLLIANYVQRNGEGMLPQPPVAPPFLDFNGDNFATSLDVTGATNSVDAMGSRQLPEPRLVVDQTPPLLGPGTFVNFRLAATDFSGNPIDEVDVGETFFLKAFVQDVSAAGRGVAAAYMDIVFDAELADVTGVPFFGAYPRFQTADTSVDGRIDNIGGGNIATRHGAAEVLLFEISVTPQARGTLTFASQPAGDSPASDVLLHGFDGIVAPSNIRFGSIDLEVQGPPVTNDDQFFVDEDQTLSVAAPGILQNDFDDPGDVFEAELLTGPMHGQLSLLPTGSFVYTPNANFFGTDSFTYRAVDHQFQSLPATVEIVVRPVNDPPVAVDDLFRTTIGTPLVVNAGTGVLNNDSDIDGDTLSVTLVSGQGPQNGQLTLAADGSFTYVPNAGFVGMDQFRYVVNDGASGTDTATATIDVLFNWQNHTHAVDINGDGFASPVDAAWLVNDLLANGPRILPTPPQPPNVAPPFLDFNGNGSVSAFDRGKVIEDLNQNGIRQLAQPRLNLPQSPAVLGVGETVGFELVTTNTAGEVTTDFAVGETILLNVMVTENVSTSPGVFSAYVDVTYNPLLVALNGEIEFAAEFPNARSANTSVPGFLDEVGAMHTVTPAFVSSQRLFTASFMATEAGSFTFASNAPDRLPGSDFTLFGVNGAVANQDMTFGSTTVSIVKADEDTDGVIDSIEAQAPNNGDGNNDGIPDSQQANVASFPSGPDQRFVTISADSQTRLRQVVEVPNPDPGSQPQNVTFPVGFFEFEITDLAPGGSTVVTIFLEPGTNANTFYRFGPTPSNPTPHWYAFLYNGETGARIFADRIEVHYTDGQLGDNDLTADGIIRDPAAPGVSASPWQNPLNPADVDNSGNVAAQDVLILVNDININGTRVLPAFPEPGSSISPFLDVDGNNEITPSDVLAAINFINDPLNNVVAEPEAFDAALAGTGQLDVVQREFEPAKVEQGWTSIVVHPVLSNPVSLAPTAAVWATESRTFHVQTNSATDRALVGNRRPLPQANTKRDEPQQARRLTAWKNQAEPGLNSRLLDDSLMADDIETAMQDIAADVCLAWRRPTGQV